VVKGSFALVYPARDVRSYSGKDCLKRHMKTHNPEAPRFICERFTEVKDDAGIITLIQCTKRYGRSDHLKRHIEHDHDKIKRWPCLQAGCGAAFDDAQGRHDHYIRTHNVDEKTLVEQIGRHSAFCKCNYRASVASGVTAHMETAESRLEPDKHGVDAERTKKNQ
jgi:hypothetical protein